MLPQKHSITIALYNLLVIHREIPSHIHYHSGNAKLFDLEDPLLKPFGVLAGLAAGHRKHNLCMRVVFTELMVTLDQSFEQFLVIFADLGVFK